MFFSRTAGGGARFGWVPGLQSTFLLALCEPDLGFGFLRFKRCFLVIFSVLCMPKEVTEPKKASRALQRLDPYNKSPMDEDLHERSSRHSSGKKSKTEGNMKRVVLGRVVVQQHVVALVRLPNRLNGQKIC